MAKVTGAMITDLAKGSHKLSVGVAPAQRDCKPNPPWYAGTSEEAGQRAAGRGDGKPEKASMPG